MCGRKPTTPPVVTRDPIAEQRQAEAEAATRANQSLAGRRARRRRSSLLTAGAAGSAAPRAGQLQVASAKPTLLGS